MIYNVTYTNYSHWKKVIFWERSFTKDHEIWSGNKIIYKNLFYLHGNFNLFKYGHHGVEASTMICLNMGYRLLSKKYQIDRLFLDDTIRSGIDLYQAFIETEDGKRFYSKKTKLITNTDSITLFFESLYNIKSYNSSLIEFADGERPNLFNYNSWLSKNISFFTDKEINDISDFAVIITVSYESLVIYFDSNSETYYLYDPQGRGLAFFDIPSNQNQNLFLAEINERIEYSNLNSYLIMTKNYNEIIKFVKNNIPYQRNFSSVYITL